MNTLLSELFREKIKTLAKLRSKNMFGAFVILIDNNYYINYSKYINSQANLYGDINKGRSNDFSDPFNGPLIGFAKNPEYRPHHYEVIFETPYKNIKCSSDDIDEIISFIIKDKLNDKENDEVMELLIRLDEDIIAIT